MHSAWLQKFYKCPTPTCTTGGVLLFEIFWSFEKIKSMKSRFVDATDEWDLDGEAVTWTITTPAGQEIVKRGHWRFSAKANSIDYLANVFDSQVGVGSCVSVVCVCMCVLTTSPMCLIHMFVSCLVLYMFLCVCVCMHEVSYLFDSQVCVDLCVCVWCCICVCVRMCEVH
jgi:hypothetical protein